MVGRKNPMKPKRKRTASDPLLADVVIDNALFCEVGKRSPAEMEYHPKMNRLIDMFERGKLSKNAFDKEWNRLEQELESDPRQSKYKKSLKKRVRAKSHTSTLHTRSW